jgi:hypothetical protein
LQEIFATFAEQAPLGEIFWLLLKYAAKSLHKQMLLLVKSGYSSSEGRSTEVLLSTR